MKKLLLILLLFLGITNQANAESVEQVNLTCTLYETFHWDDLTTSDLRPEDSSLIIYPEMKLYTFEGYTYSYYEVGNEIHFSYNSDCTSEACLKREYSLDRTSSVFQYTLSQKWSGTNNKWEPALTHKGKCKKTDNLF